jgi:peptide/nickel transport system substrate-binding protein
MKKVISIILASLLAVGFTGCGEKSQSDSVSSDVSAVSSNSDVESQKHINVAFFWISAGLDPAVDYDGWVTSRLGTSETLIKLDDELKIEACLSDEWENIDENTWYFHIRDGVNFTTGNPVTAQAAADSIMRAVEANPRAEEYLKIDHIDADGQDLTIVTSEPNAALLNNMAEPVFSIIDTSCSDDEIRSEVCGTGPYMVSEFVSENKVELTANPDYWDGEPGLDSITVTQIADSDARAMALQSKEIDLTNTIDNTTLKLFTDNSDYNVSSIISPRVNVAYMNNADSSPLSDVELRKAVSYAVDREAYANLIGGSAAHSAYSDSTPFGNDTIDAIEYDPNKAVEILDKAGYTDKDNDGFREDKVGDPLKLKYLQAADHGSADSAILAQAVQSDLKKVGIDVEILAVENLSDYQSSGDFDFYTANDNSAPTGDPQLMLETMYTTNTTSGKQNLTGYHNDEIDKIIEEMNKTFDTEGRYKLAAQASQILNDTAANLFLTNSYINMVSLARVKNAVQPVCDYYFITKEITVE